jgi:hypothetical protein
MGSFIISVSALTMSRMTPKTVATCELYSSAAYERRS